MRKMVTNGQRRIIYNLEFEFSTSSKVINIAYLLLACTYVLAGMQLSSLCVLQVLAHMHTDMHTLYITMPPCNGK